MFFHSFLFFVIVLFFMTVTVLRSTDEFYFVECPKTGISFFHFLIFTK
jgi:hypothetical protein